MELSVVIPVHNDEPMLNLCLNALASRIGVQSDPFEVIVVDDGSSQDIRSAVGRFIAQKPGIDLKYVRLDENAGRFMARVAGVKRAAYRNILLLDVRALIGPDFLSVLASLGYQPALPMVDSMREGWVSTVLYLIRHRLYSRTYDELESKGEVTLTQDNYELYSKGTTAVYVDRVMFLSACASTGYTDKHSHEESWLLREIIKQKPIKIFRDLKITYQQRTGLLEECLHLFYRGPRFVQYYSRPGTRFFPLLLFLLASPVVLLALAILFPGILSCSLAAFVIAIIAASTYFAKQPEDMVKVASILPLLSFSFALGLFWGAAIHLFGAARGV